MKGLKEIKDWQDEQAREQLAKQEKKLEDYKWPGDPAPAKQDRPAEPRHGC